MEYRQFGTTGLVVSRLCLGTMTFGAETTEAVSHEQLDTYRAAGGTFVDTADVYGAGASEAIIGRWLKARDGARDEIVLATKARFPMGTHPNAVGLSRRHLDLALEASLRRLQVDTIDLYQLHAWDPVTPIDESLRFLDDAVRAGKVRYVGVSNFTGWQIAAIVERARALGTAVPISVQPQHNLLSRMTEAEIIPACQHYGLATMPWSPLAGGWLTGKYKRSQRPTGDTRLGDDPNRGMEAYDRRASEHTWAVLDAVQQVSDETGLTMAQVSLAWLADQPGVTTPILGARTVEQLTASLEVAQLHLGDDHRAELDRVSAPDLPDYPYGELGIDQRARDLPSSDDQA